jgi:hypothetical protein
MAKSKQRIASDLYTAVLAIATMVVLASAVFVTFRLNKDYGTIFKTGTPGGLRSSLRR